MGKLYGRPTSNLTWHETQALAYLRQALPPGRTQDRDLPVPGQPAHYYPAGTKEMLERKERRRFPAAAGPARRP